MNVPTQNLLDELLLLVGASSLGLGNGSIGLIAAPFTPAENLTLASLTEANFHGYSRKSLGTPTITFTGGDGNEYIEFNTVNWQCSDTVSPNTIYGLFFTAGNNTITLQSSDKFTVPLPMSGPSNQITVTPRFGLNPGSNYGLNIISN